MNELSAQSQRTEALDAFRGIAIVGMIFSGQLPFHANVLPAWMYHAQVPPPHHIFDPTLPGITWVDLVFPFFLFAMGAAVPLALSKKIERGVPSLKILFSIVGRGALLGFFALYVQAIRPYQLSAEPDVTTWIVSLVAFFFLFPMYGNFPERWNNNLRRGLKTGGWTCAILFFVFTVYPDGSGFTLTRSDIIIIVLANMALFGSLAWFVTRKNLLLRLGILAVLLAIRLSNKPVVIEGWVHDIYSWSPIPWLYTMYYQQYLFIVLPGTIVGDLILQWRSNSQEKNISGEHWSSRRYVTIATLMMTLVIVLVSGMFARLLIETTIAAFLLCGIGYWTMHKPTNETEKMYLSVFQWSVFWLVLGLFFEPFEGGIKKDRATLSYYFVTSGLAGCMIVFFSIIIDIFKKRMVVQLFIDSGQNPMIAYAGINNFVIPVLGMTGILSMLTSMVTSPLLGLIKGLIITLLLVLMTALCTRMKIYWKT